MALIKHGQHDWMVKAYDSKGGYWMECPEDSEADARAAALRILSVRGQKSWLCEVYGPNGRIAIYKRGKELK